MNKVELLSPVGRLESAYAAIENGADAIYLGGMKFGARAFADNFSEIQMQQVIAYAHAYQVKVYITMNTLLFDNEFIQARAYIQQLYDMKVDALIVQDLGLLYYLREHFSDFDVHASTQMHIYNRQALLFLATQGVTRAVLARECSIEKIRSFRDIPIEKEVFVHGALCVSYSGQCLFSSINNQRSGNRGECAQSCRMKYDLLQEDTTIKKDMYLLSPRDLNTLEDIPELLEVGIDSFKIEGRMKSNEYVAYTTALYRKAMDQQEQTMKTAEIETLKVLFNRTYTKGHAFHNLGTSFINEYRPNHMGVELGEVVKNTPKQVFIKLSGSLHQFDAIRFLLKKDEGCILNRLYKDDLLVSKAEAGEVVAIDMETNIPVGSKVVKTKDTLVEKTIQETYLEHTRKLALKANLIIRIGEPLQLKLYDKDHHILVKSEELVERAQKRPITDEDIQKKLHKTGDSKYYFEDIQITAHDDVFISLKTISELKRKGLLAFEQHLLTSFKRKDRPFYLSEQDIILPQRTSITVQYEEQLLACLTYPQFHIFVEDHVLYTKYQHEGQVHLASSNIYDKDYEGVELVGELGGFDSGRDIDYTLNIQNAYALTYASKLQNRYICLGLELQDEGLADLMKSYQEKASHTTQVEYVVYVKPKLMSMEYCPVNDALLDNDKKHCALCKKRPYYLKNTQGQQFYLHGDENCTMSLYNNVAIDRLEQIPYYQSLGIQNFRLCFIDEDTATIHKILKKFQNYYQ